MRTHVLAAAMTLGMSFDGGVASAAQCFYDSDCPVGTECRSGACVVVGSQSSAPATQPGGKPNGTVIILGVAVIVLAVVLYVSVQQNAPDVPQPLLMPAPGPPAQGLGFSVRF